MELALSRTSATIGADIMGAVAAKTYEAPQPESKQIALVLDAAAATPAWTVKNEPASPESAADDIMTRLATY